MKEYLIIEEGNYSDYSVYFIEKDSRLTDEEVLTLLSSDSNSSPSIGGKMMGEITLLNGGLRVENIKEVAFNGINRIFCCYPSRPHSDVTDRFYTKEELLDIAIKNDNSGVDYWSRNLDTDYRKYTTSMEIFSKLKV